MKKQLTVPFLVLLLAVGGAAAQQVADLPVVSMHLLARGDSDAVRQLDGRGPARLPIDLSSLEIDGLDQFPELGGLARLTHLSLEVYPDENPESGIFYYLPAGYFLTWDAASGYHLEVYYKYDEGSGDGNQVVFDARLSPGPLDRDRQFLRALLEVYLRERGTAEELIGKTRLLEVPATYDVSFDWSQLGIPEAELNVSGIDRASREIALTLTADVGTRQLLVDKLGSSLGLVGEVRLTPQPVTAEGEALPPQTIRARLLLTDPAYADAPWQRSAVRYSFFRNRHPFPVRLKYLCYLYRDRDRLHLRGFGLGRRRLEPGQIARLPNAKITNQIDDQKRVLRAWYVYDLENLESSRESVIAELTGGTGSLPVRRLKIDLLSPAELFGQFQIAKLLVAVKSRFFDPQSREEITKVYELVDGDSGVEIAPLYAPEDLGEPLYHYRIGLLTSAGVESLDEEWRSPGEFGDINIGSVQVEEVLGR